jgi:hypothetical protein
MFFEIHLLNAIELIAFENPDGFTLDLETMELIASGIVVAYQATQDSFGKIGLQTCLEHALNHNKLVGGWRNPNGLFQFDSVRVFESLPMAIRFGRMQKQYAIFDIDNGWEIVL